MFLAVRNANGSPVTADSAIMHPKEKIIALKGRLPIFRCALTMFSRPPAAGLQPRDQAEARIPRHERGRHVLGMDQRFDPRHGH